MKTCSACKIQKHLTEFDSKRGKPQARCKSCRAEYMAAHYQANLIREKAMRKAWYEKNKLAVCEKMRENRKANAGEINLTRRLKKFDLTRERYLQMVQDCNNSCEICSTPFTDTPQIDHCHNSLIVRGLLCSKCNTGFGLLQENIAIFEKCAAYALKYKK